MLEIQVWGLLSRVAQLKKMEKKSILAKKNNKSLGKNWIQELFFCHLILQAKYSCIFDQDQLLA